MAEDSPVGAWRLVSMEYVSEDGEASYPLGPDASGYIMYHPNGYMSVNMMSANRPTYASQDLKGGTDEEKVAAAETYISYCGRYEVQGNKVIHHVEVAFFPNRVGADLERTFTVSGNRLSIRTPPILVEGKERTGRLEWERA